MTTNTASTTALTLSGLGEITISATAETLAERDRLLELVRRGKRIADGESAKRAGEILREVKRFTRGIESARKDTKDPVLDLTRRIDGLAKEVTAELEREAARVSGLLGEWQAEENRKAEEARRKAWEEEQRIRREREAAERAEAERLAREWAEREAKARAEQEAAEAKAARARSEAGREKARKEAEAAKERAAAEAEEARKKAIADAQARDEQAAIDIGKAHATAAVVQAAKPQGIAARRDVEFEITDAIALFEAAPYLVKLEPNKSAIKSALKQLGEGQTLPGVRHWFTTKAIAKG